MKKVRAADLSTSSERVWWNDAEINRALNAGVVAGHLSRLSTTQVQWTTLGVKTLQTAQAAEQVVDLSDRGVVVDIEDAKSPQLALQKVGTEFMLSTSQMDTDRAGRERITPAGRIWRVVERQLLPDATTQYSVTCKATGAQIDLLHSDLSRSGFREVPNAHQQPFNAALAALEIASLDGGESDLPMYKAALKGLRNLRDGILAYDKELDDAEIPPTGDDYNRLLALSGLAIPVEHREAVLSARTFALISVVEPPIRLFEQSLHDADFMKPTARGVLTQLEQVDNWLTSSQINAIHGVLADASRRYRDMGVVKVALEEAITAVEEEAAARDIALTPHVEYESVEKPAGTREMPETRPRYVVPDSKQIEALHELLATFDLVVSRTGLPERLAGCGELHAEVNAELERVDEYWQARFHAEAEARAAATSSEVLRIVDDLLAESGYFSAGRGYLALRENLLGEAQSHFPQDDADGPQIDL
jgi:hypothetical protein